MIKIETRTVAVGNLLDIPSGKSYSAEARLQKGETCKPSEMIHVTRIPGKMSQRAFYEKMKDEFGLQIQCKIFRAGQHVWTKSGDIEVVRGEVYHKAMQVGATHGRRDGKKPETGYTFEISTALY